MRSAPPFRFCAESSLARSGDDRHGWVSANADAVTVLTKPVPSSAASARRVSAAGKFLRADGARFPLHGLTYGPFGPGDRNHGLPDAAAVTRDLRMMREWGANTLRLYHEPPEWFLDRCAENGLRAVVSIPWTDHVDFLRGREEARAARREIRDTARRLTARPEIAALLVGNEIQATLVRWLGARRVQHFLEELIDVAHQAAPETLAAYANYPGTEFLQPGNADFTAFNVYLEDRAAFDRYVARLQNIAGDKPLVLTEFGVDAQNHGPERQAEILTWQREVCAAHGVAGNLLFSFTDEWHRGGESVTGWSFGLTTAQREPRPAWTALAGGPPAVPPWPRGDPPRVSVIVCTRNGSRTLEECLASLKALRYPDFEIILVDDGSTDRVPEIAHSMTGLTYIRQDHAGLGVARNTGAAAATGDILAYTDDDCVADPDWLTFLTRAMADPAMGAAGGPNIPPPPQNLAQACVIAAPGGPAHVLLSDRLAEHVPGCNLAVKRAAFDSITGFRPKYHAAGDDVDFCWRLQEAGVGIGFHPAAMVWHYRRFTVGAFLRQQAGYGKAEALLMARHSGRFGQIGGARWRGVVYHPALVRLLHQGSRIYTGVFGYAPFQAIYSPPLSEASWIITSLPWWILALLFLAASVWLPVLGFPGALMLALTLGSTARQAWTLTLPRPYDGLPGRLLLWFLLLAQPTVRGWSRFAWTVRTGSSPGGPWFRPRWNPGKRLRFSKHVAELAYWSETGLDRDTLLTELGARFQTDRHNPRLDDGWRDWDVDFSTSPWWRVRLSTVTEYHAGDSRLTRVRLLSHATPRHIFLNVALAVLTALLIPLAGLHPLWAVGLFFIWTVLFETGHHTAVSRAAKLTNAAAQAAGFTPAPPNEKPPAEPASAPDSDAEG